MDPQGGAGVGPAALLQTDLEPDWSSVRPRSGIETSSGTVPARRDLPEPRLSSSLGDSNARPSFQRHTLPRNATFHDVRSSRRPAMLDRASSNRVASIDLGLPPVRQADVATDWRATAVGVTPLDRTMDAIGMGRYQWTVLILSGLGWTADNMWIQAVAVILPHVQRTFEVTDAIVGLASSSIFVGMFVGSLVWGTISDSYGRRAAFNMTLLITAVFGTLSALSTSFGTLCILLFAVGSGVGGSMPTDSSNLVENLPTRKHSYVTALSVFFSAGAVIPSIIGLVVLSDSASSGWRWLLGCLAAVTITFVSARVVFFRLLESPKYLVHAGRPQEARDILQRIQRFNGGNEVTIKLRDVCDDAVQGNPSGQGSAGPSTPRQSTSTRGTVPKRWQPTSRLRSGQKGYQSLPTADEEDEEAEEEQGRMDAGEGAGSLADDDNEEPGHTVDFELPGWLAALPEAWHPTVADLLSRYAELFSEEWKQTTILVWIIWGGMSFAFTTFNVFLPKLLEERYGKADPSAPSGSKAAMVDYLVYNISSLPGSLISAYLVETRLGRIGTMASSTALTGLSVLAFALTSWRASLTLISIAASISYAAIYGYTPEVMGPKIRGTACGSASAISRVTGIVAPLTAGLLFSINSNLPVYLAFASFAGVSAAMTMLPIETRGRGGGGQGDEGPAIGGAVH